MKILKYCLRGITEHTLGIHRKTDGYHISVFYMNVLNTIYIYECSSLSEYNKI